MKKLTTAEFITKSIDVHGNKYDYTNSTYIGSKIKLDIVCVDHGEFRQRPNDHLNGQGCPLCKHENTGNRCRSTNAEFIKKSTSIYGHKYDYSLVEYINSFVNIKIICPEHGIFLQKPVNHLSGRGCTKCGYKNRINPNSTNMADFIFRCNNTHKNKYDYSSVNYINCMTKVCIICHKHGEFWQLPTNHWYGKGCPICKSSQGNKQTAIWLDSHNIRYIREYRYDDCRNKNPLPFDFYLPELNTCIEYDGRQHFEPVECFGGMEGFLQTQLHDKIKTAYCEDHGIRLIRIRYDESFTSQIEYIFR